MTIDKVTVTRSLLGKFLNYGTIKLINLTGRPLTIHYVSNPQKLQDYALRLIQEQKTLYESYLKTENIQP